MNGFFIALLLAIFALIGGPTLWKRNMLVRLKTGSQKVETEYGLLEYAILNPQTDGDKLPVLLLHATPGGYDQGLMLGRHNFDSDQMVIAVSRPGYLGTPVESARTAEDQADMYASLLAQLNVPHVIVCGVSGGGPSAIQFALRYPGQTAALILGSAAVRAINTSIDDVPIFMTSTMGSWFTLNLARFIPSLLGKDVATNASLAKSALALAQTSFPLDFRRDGWRNDTQQLRTLPDYPFAQIQCPTLFIHGTADETVPFTHAQTAAQAVANGRLMVIEGGRHIFSMMDSAAVGRMREFVQSVSSLNRDKITADNSSVTETPLHSG
jgi:pimeloyl-ACP methyl ester carboxylesterase